MKVIKSLKIFKLLELTNYYNLKRFKSLIKQKNAGMKTVNLNYNIVKITVKLAHINKAFVFIVESKLLIPNFINNQ